MLNGAVWYVKVKIIYIVWDIELVIREMFFGRVLRLFEGNDKLNLISSGPQGDRAERVATFVK